MEECLESICRQTCKDLEILLIDDGSADSSPQICERFAEKDSRVRFFQKENGGPSDTRNYGIERASGDYIMFFDSDDYAEPTLCEKLLQAIE
ncbi:MAG: glycosyltransferase family 2 protein, partial [Ruminococcus sp.]|nr:glycosyltransferase family 2 protein [Ruminococcus sp.]